MESFFRKWKTKRKLKEKCGIDDVYTVRQLIQLCRIKNIFPFEYESKGSVVKSEIFYKDCISVADSYSSMGPLLNDFVPKYDGDELSEKEKYENLKLLFRKFMTDNGIEGNIR
jgi:hypothetical protein